MYPPTGPQQCYGETASGAYPCSPVAQEEGWTIGTDSVDPRKLQNPAFQRTYRRDANCWTDGSEWDGSLSNTPPPVDSGSFASPEYQYHYPFGAPLYMDYANDVIPRQSPTISNCFDLSGFIDPSQRAVGSSFTPLPSPEHSMSGFEQTADPASGHNFRAMSNYPLYQEPTQLPTGGHPDQDQVIMWDPLLHDVALNQAMEHPSYFRDVTIMTPASDTLNSGSPPGSNCSIDENKDADGSNALQKAGFHGHDAVVELLLDSGADVEARNTRDQTTLHLAAQQGYSNVVKILLERHANCNVKDGLGLTPLHLASKFGHQNVVRLLLSASIDINEHDNEGQNALHYACENGFLGIVQLLVDRGIKLNLRSNSGLTPLHRAAESGHDSVVRLLLKRGADVNAKSDNG